MAAKQLSFGDEAREKIRRGVDTLAEAVKVTLGPRGRTVILRARLRRAADRQLRRAGGQVDRAGGPLREHGRAAAARGGGAHQRDGRRRHHHRHGAGARHDPRGPALPGRRHEPDGPQARHRAGHRGGGGRAEAHRAALRHARRRSRTWPRSRPTTTARSASCWRSAIDKVGREGAISIEDGSGTGQRARGGRGPAVRPRLPVALLHQQRRAPERGAGGRGHPAVRPEAVVAEGSAAAARSRWSRPAGRCW